MVIVDECHHVASDSYKSVLSALNIPRLVGFTATAFRSDGKGLASSFDRVVYELNIKDLIERGYLCPPKGYQGCNKLRPVRCSMLWWRF